MYDPRSWSSSTPRYGGTRVYLNTDFFDAPSRAYSLGPFAAGYVTAHEVAHHVQQLLGLHARVAAAAVVGDDYQRNRAGVELAPETWTHGSSEQRVHWVSVGKDTGVPGRCDTFSGG